MNNVDEKLKIYRQYLQMLGNKIITSVIFKSKGGFGKSYNTIRILKEEKLEYTYITGHTTPLELYKMLYNNNGKIIVIDDIEEIFIDKKSVSLLKSALWEVDSSRTISYKTSTDMHGVPTSFKFTGGIVMLVNELKKKHDDSFKALISRTVLYELAITHDEFMRMTIDIIKDTNEIDVLGKQKALELVAETLTPNTEFNFRLVDKIIKFIKFDPNNAKELFLSSIRG